MMVKLVLEPIPAVSGCGRNCTICVYKDHLDNNDQDYAIMNTRLVILPLLFMLIAILCQAWTSDC